MTQNGKEVKISIKAADSMLGGAYSNNMILHMNREEFVLDFINFVPPGATLNARVCITPGNFKRMIRTMSDSISRYEKEFGILPEPPAPQLPTEIVQ